MKGSTVHTWAAVGQTPTIRVPMSQWDRVSVIGGVTRDGRVITNSVVGSVNSVAVVKYLQYVLEQVSGKVIVVLDNARIHKSKLVNAFLVSEPRLEIVHTPPYAPECNPVEWLWAWVKKTELRGLPARSVDDLRRAWRRGLAKVRACPDLVAGFFAGSALKC